MPLPLPQTKEFNLRITALADECRSELEEASQSLQEIGLLVTQSASEVDRLSQRELTLANRVREMEANLESYGRAEIRDLYHASQEVQLRLMMMRNQVEQLEEREKSIRSYQEKLRLLLELAESYIRAEQERQSEGDTKTRILRRNTSNGVREIPFAEIIQAQEDERQRVAQHVIDGPAQIMSNLILEAEICERLFERDPEQARQELGELRSRAVRALRDTRMLLYELRPIVLREIGVVPTLRRYMGEISRQYNTEVNIIGPESDEKLPEILRIAFYRLLQQMVSACATQGKPKRIDVDVRYEDAQIVGRVEVTTSDMDKGQGIARFLADEAVRRRIEQLGADLQSELIGSSGARLSVVIPIN